jgi:hypothetical protein
MPMLRWLDKMSNKAFDAMKWALTALSGAFTTGLIIALES